MNIIERIGPVVQRVPSIAVIPMSHFHMMS